MATDPIDTSSNIVIKEPVISRPTLISLPLITIVSLLSLVIGLGGTSYLAAQENPFETSGDPFATADEGGAEPDSAGQTASTQGRSGPIEEPVVGDEVRASARLLIRSVKASDPQTPPELAKALQVMIDIRQFAQAKYYLSRLDASIKDDAQRLKLVNDLGSDFFLTLHATQELAPDGKSFAREVLAASKKLDQSPQQIQSLLELLKNPDIAIRSRAFRHLRQIGPSAIAALVDVFASEQQQDLRPGVRGALYQMGDQAIPLLRGAARSNDVTVATEALRALGHYRNPGTFDLLAAAALAAQGAAETRVAAMKAVRRRGGVVPDQNALAARLKRRAKALLMGTEQVSGNLLGMTTAWDWDVKSKSLQATRVTIATAARIEAARGASDLYQMLPAVADHRELYLLTQLEVAKRMLGTSEQLTPKQFAERLTGSGGATGPVSATELNRLLEKAIEYEAIPAAIACCDLLAKQGTPELFYSNGARPCPLVGAILLGDRHLQYAALNATQQLAPRSAYPGSSHVLKLALFLAGSDQQDKALVGHHRPQTAQLIAGSLGPAGLRGAAADSSRDFFEMATQDPDIRLLLISDTLNRPRYDDLVNQLRSDFRTARTPIGLMLRDSRSARAVARQIEREPLTSAFPISADAEVLAAQIRETLAVADADSLTVDTGARYRHAELAFDWLATVAADSQSFGYYDLGRYQEQLVGFLYAPGFAAQASEILSHLATPLAQRELANFASQQTLLPRDRRVAANALGKAIDRTSTLLTKEQIKQQYNRYNASETRTDGSQEILGSILDSIEQRAERSP